MADGMIFNQTNMDTAISNINSRLEETAGMITRESANFVSYISQNWECQYAVDFANEYNTEMQSIIQKLQNNVNVAYDILNTARARYAEGTGNTLTVGAITYTTPTVDVSPIQIQFANGDVGIRQGFSVDGAVKALDSIINDLNSSFDNLNRTITSCGALSDSEMSAYAATLSKVGDITGSEFDGLKSAANTLVTKTIEQFTTIQSTNVGDMQGA